jgi:hypothetical protein
MSARDKESFAFRAKVYVRTSRWLRRGVQAYRHDALWTDGRVDLDINLGKVMYRSGQPIAKSRRRPCTPHARTLGSDLGSSTAPAPWSRAPHGLCWRTRPGPRALSSRPNPDALVPPSRTSTACRTTAWARGGRGLPAAGPCVLLASGVTPLMTGVVSPLSRLPRMGMARGDQRDARTTFSRHGATAALER